MREIKFRIFSYSTKTFLKVGSKIYENSNKFYCGLEFFGGDDIRIEYYWNDNIDETFVENADESKFAINQYTGLKDCKGGEIYEGDIIEFALSLFESVKGSVEFDYGTFYLKPTDKKYDNLILANMNFDLVEIIGNIYENSELWGDKNE